MYSRLTAWLGRQQWLSRKAYLGQKRKVNLSAILQPLTVSHSSLNLKEERALQQIIEPKRVSPHLLRKIVMDIYLHGKNPSERILFAAIGVATRWRLMQELSLYYELSRNVGLRPGPPFYASCITVCACRRDLNTALRLFHEVKQESIEPDLKLYNALIFASAAVGDAEKVKEFVALLQSDGLQLDETTYALLMECCRLRGEYEEALKIFESMVVSPNYKAFNVAFSVCNEMNNYELAMKYFESFERHNLYSSELSHSSLIEVCLKNERFDEAMGFFDLSHRKRHYVMESTYGIALLSLLQCPNRRYSDVARILKRKPAYRCIPLVYYKDIIDLTSHCPDVKLRSKIIECYKQDVAHLQEIDRYVKELTEMGSVGPPSELRSLVISSRKIRLKGSSKAFFENIYWRTFSVASVQRKWHFVWRSEKIQMEVAEM
ncbi:Pentatricopeptide repeat-containing protein [Galdieria sulphuraria]|nr:Pentatricopeptide repeat-containing protein [Galdieria sulphuraria]